MKRFTFDITLATAAYVTADTEGEARRLLAGFRGLDEIGAVGDGVTIGGAEVEGEHCLIDVEDL